MDGRVVEHPLHEGVQVAKSIVVVVAAAAVEHSQSLAAPVGDDVVSKEDESVDCRSEVRVFS